MNCGILGAAARALTVRIVLALFGCSALVFFSGSISTMFKLRKNAVQNAYQLKEHPANRQTPGVALPIPELSRLATAVSVGQEL